MEYNHELTLIFKAMALPARIAKVTLLREGALCVEALATKGANHFQGRYPSTYGYSGRLAR